MKKRILLVLFATLLTTFTTTIGFGANPPSDADTLWADLTARWEKLTPKRETPAGSKRLATSSAPKRSDYEQVATIAREFQNRYPKDSRCKEAKRRENFALMNIAIIETKARGRASVRLDTTRLTPTKQVYAVYPMEMESSGESGEVTVEFALNEKGRPQNPVVVLSSDTRFDKPALDAIGKWRFKIPNPTKPDSLGNIYAKLSDARWQYEVNFGKTRTPFSGSYSPNTPNYSPGYTVDYLGNFTYGSPASGSPVTGASSGASYTMNSASTPGQNVIQPVLPHESVEPVAPVYPYSMLAKNIKGSATVRMPCNTGWKNVRADIIAASRESFGYALAAAMQYYKVTPSRYKGQPVASMLAVTFDFSPENPELRISEKTKQLLADETRNPEKIIPADKLDSPLTCQKDASISTRLANAGLEGSAIVEFLIDETGRVYLPRIIKAGNLELAYMLMQEISMRVYTPPMQNGNPVVARVREKMVF